MKYVIPYGSIVTLFDEYRTYLEYQIRHSTSLDVDYYSTFLKNNEFVYLGDIAQMPGHCIIAGQKEGRIYMGFHTEDFRILTGEEV